MAIILVLLAGLVGRQQRTFLMVAGLDSDAVPRCTRAEDMRVSHLARESSFAEQDLVRLVLVLQVLVDPLQIAHFALQGSVA